MTCNRERQVRRQYVARFGVAPPWNLGLDVVALTRLMRQALRTGTAIDWSLQPLHPYDQWINERGEPV